MSYTSGNPRHARRSSESNAEVLGVSSGTHNPRAMNPSSVSDQAVPNGGSNGQYPRYKAQSYVGSTSSEPSDDAQFDDSLRSGASAIAAAKRSRKKHKHKVAAIALTSIALVLGLFGAAFAFVMTLDSNLHSRIDSSLFNALIPVDTPGDPFYILLLGTDGSAERSQSSEYASDSYRSDSMILARIDPKNKKVSMVSIPRDTEVDLGEHGKQKINAAHAFGGPALAVQTVSELAGVPISHYAELDFDGFREVVDALGGIDVNVPMAIDDYLAGGSIDSGQQTLNGDQALIMCRSRHNYDDYGNGDAYRAANQRLVLSAIAQKLLSVDPFSIANVVSTLTQYAITDLNVSEIVAIAQSMRGLDSQTDIYTATAPTTSEYKNGGWYEILDEKGFKTMIARMNEGLPPVVEDDVDPSTGIVIASTGAENGKAVEAFNKKYYNITKNAEINLRNGNGKDGVCAAAEDILKTMGYSKINTANANSFDYDTTLVIYKTTGNADEAQLISDELGVGRAMLDDGTYLFESDYLIVIGKDWPDN